MPMTLRLALPSPGAYGGSPLRPVPYADLQLQLPDTWGSNVAVSGPVFNTTADVTGNASGFAAPVAASGTPALPSPPGSGSTFCTFVVDLTTGVLSILTSASAFPAAAAGQLAVAQVQVPANAANPPYASAAFQALRPAGY